jgi:hypothetical protein
MCMIELAINTKMADSMIGIQRAASEGISTPPVLEFFRAGAKYSAAASPDGNGRPHATLSFYSL